MFDRLRETSQAMPFYPGIESLLYRLAPANIAIVSGNARAVIAAKLAEHGLFPQISCIYGTRQPGDKCEKILRACRLFGVDPANTCMIGDSVSDIRFAKMAGVSSIAVTKGTQVTAGHVLAYIN